jgi:hypothetical protein
LKPILLFYREFERDKFFKYDRYLKRIVRPLYNLTHHRQKKTGFGVSFELMARSLRNEGWDVRINDRSFARKHPEYPVGLVGFPLVLEDWDLPNPAILGPTLYDHPMLAPRLMEDPRFRIYLVIADWMYNLFQPVYGDAVRRWFAGIDTNEWQDTAGCAKSIDFLIYDKIRWDHDQLAAGLLAPIKTILNARGLTTEVVRYKFHDHATYKKLLQRSRALLFLCEHETQGLAYQEAMASNVPVLAWDNGYWLDPLWQRFGTEKVPASSVPFFSPECGERFVGLADFESALDRFLQRQPTLQPRSYVMKHLSMKRSAETYAELYFSLLR